MIDYEYWDSENEFTIYEAAWLWIEEEPKVSSSERPTKYLKTLNSIYEATRSGKLNFRDTTLNLNGVYGDGEIYVTRDGLKNFALNIDKKPKFLFPEMRSNPKPLQNKFVATKLEEGRQDETISSLLKIVLGMAISFYTGPRFVLRTARLAMFTARGVSRALGNTDEC